MYLEKEKIKNIDNYDIVNDFLFVENSKVKNHQNSTILDLKKIDYWGVSFYEKVFNVFTNRSHNSFYNYKGELLKEISKFNFYKFEDLNNYVGYDRELKKTVFIVNGIKENELEIKLGINCFYKNYIFLTIGNEVSIINCFKNKQLLWKLDLNEFILNDESLKMTKFICVYNDKLILSCSEHTILSIDTNTGKILNKWRELPGVNIDSQKEGLIPDSKSFILDEEQNKLIGVFRKYYIEINLITNEIIFTDLSKELKGYEIIFIKQINNNPFTNTHLYLTAMMEQKSNDNKWSFDCLFALNKETLKIDWINKFKKQSLGTNIPKISEKKLFQLDNDNVLHIFEKQSKN